MTNPHDNTADHTPLCQLATTKFCEMDRRYAQKFEALEEAISKAEHAMNIRLESMNQFRQQILEERTDFATRRESVLVAFLISLILMAVGIITAHLMGK